MNNKAYNAKVFAGQIGVIALVIMALAALGLSCSVIFANESRSEIIDCSLVALLADPQRYNGKLVRTSGFAIVRFEESAIYLSRDDAEHTITENAVWIGSPAKGVPFTSLHGRYIMVEGQFRAQSDGLQGAFFGSIEHISRTRILEKHDLNWKMN